MRAHAFEFAKQDMIRLCHSALDSRTLRFELLKRLQMVIPFDYVYFSTTDPATHLVTNSVIIEEPPSWLMQVFVENEFLQPDFNKFNHMFKKQQTISILSQATGHELHRSPRYQEILIPMKMEDELRAIFVTNDACWGSLCLHRGKSELNYTSAEANFLAQLAPHIADGLRKAVLLDSVFLGNVPDGPGVMLLTEDLSIVAMTATAEYWLMELAETEDGDQQALPITVRSVVAGLKAIENGLMLNVMPKIRLHTRSGHWLMLYASRLISSENQGLITVIFELAQPAEIAPLIMQAYLFTKCEGEITQCVLRGWSTNEIATNLYISPNTVQDHLKAIFEKVNVRTRGELAARIFFWQYHG